MEKRGLVLAVVLILGAAFLANSFSDTGMVPNRMPVRTIFSVVDNSPSQGIPSFGQRAGGGGFVSGSSGNCEIPDPICTTRGTVIDCDERVIGRGTGGSEKIACEDAKRNCRERREKILAKLEEFENSCRSAGNLGMSCNFVEFAPPEIYACDECNQPLITGSQQNYQVALMKCEKKSLAGGGGGRVDNYWICYSIGSVYGSSGCIGLSEIGPLTKH